MKKIISGISALAMVMALTPMSAFADTTITEADTLPKTADSSVEFTVDPAFTVTIPAKVTLEKGEDNIYSNSGTIKAESVFLNEGKLYNKSCEVGRLLPLRTASTIRQQTQ